MSAQLKSFVEESCWDGQDGFRPVRKSVTFRLVSVGKIAGKRVDLEFESDFGVFYDPEDDFLMAALAQADPSIDWSQFVYWKKLDRSGIGVINPENDKTVAKITVRKRMGGDPAGEMDMTNVVVMKEWEKKRGTDAS